MIMKLRYKFKEFLMKKEDQLKSYADRVKSEQNR